MVGWWYCRAGGGRSVRLLDHRLRSSNSSERNVGGLSSGSVAERIRNRNCRRCSPGQSVSDRIIHSGGAGRVVHLLFRTTWSQIRIPVSPKIDVFFPGQIFPVPLPPPGGEGRSKIMAPKYTQQNIWDQSSSEESSTPAPSGEASDAAPQGRTLWTCLAGNGVVLSFGGGMNL